MIPRIIKDVRRELPPYEANGRVMPTMGTTPKFMPMFRNT
jgi:hypothetical protein